MSRPALIVFVVMDSTSSVMILLTEQVTGIIGLMWACISSIERRETYALGPISIMTMWVIRFVVRRRSRLFRIVRWRILALGEKGTSVVNQWGKGYWGVVRGVLYPAFGPSGIHIVYGHSFGSNGLESLCLASFWYWVTVRLQSGDVNACSWRNMCLSEVLVNSIQTKCDPTLGESTLYSRSGWRAPPRRRRFRIFASTGWLEMSG